MAEKIVLRHYTVESFDPVKKEYILVHKETGAKKRISNYEFDRLCSEQMNRR